MRVRLFVFGCLLFVCLLVVLLVCFVLCLCLIVVVVFICACVCLFVCVFARVFFTRLFVCFVIDWSVGPPVLLPLCVCVCLFVFVCLCVRTIAYPFASFPLCFRWFSCGWPLVFCLHNLFADLFVVLFDRAFHCLRAFLSFFSFWLVVVFVACRLVLRVLSVLSCVTCFSCVAVRVCLCVCFFWVWMFVCLFFVWFVFISIVFFLLMLCSCRGAQVRVHFFICLRAGSRICLIIVWFVCPFVCWSFGRSNRPFDSFVACMLPCVCLFVFACLCVRAFVYPFFLLRLQCLFVRLFVCV